MTLLGAKLNILNIKAQYLIRIKKVTFLMFILPKATVKKTDALAGLRRCTVIITSML